VPPTAGGPTGYPSFPDFIPYADLRCHFAVDLLFPSNTGRCDQIDGGMTQWIRRGRRDEKN
jgi:hypothetical protein